MDIVNNINKKKENQLKALAIAIAAMLVTEAFIFLFCSLLFSPAKANANGIEGKDWRFYGETTDSKKEFATYQNQIHTIHENSDQFIFQMLCPRILEKAKIVTEEDFIECSRIVHRLLRMEAQNTDTFKDSLTGNEAVPGSPTHLVKRGSSQMLSSSFKRNPPTRSPAPSDYSADNLYERQTNTPPITPGEPVRIIVGATARATKRASQSATPTTDRRGSFEWMENPMGQRTRGGSFEKLAAFIPFTGRGRKLSIYAPIDAQPAQVSIPEEISEQGLVQIPEVILFKSIMIGENVSLYQKLGLENILLNLDADHQLVYLKKLKRVLTKAFTQSLTDFYFRNFFDAPVPALEAELANEATTLKLKPSHVQWGKTASLFSFHGRGEATYQGENNGSAARKAENILIAHADTHRSSDLDIKLPYDSHVVKKKDLAMLQEALEKAQANFKKGPAVMLEVSSFTMTEMGQLTENFEKYLRHKELKDKRRAYYENLKTSYPHTIAPLFQLGNAIAAPFANATKSLYKKTSSYQRRKEERKDFRFYSTLAQHGEDGIRSIPVRPTTKKRLSKMPSGEYQDDQFKLITKSFNAYRIDENRMRTIQALSFKNTIGPDASYSPMNALVYKKKGASFKEIMQVGNSTDLTPDAGNSFLRMIDARMEGLESINIKSIRRIFEFTKDADTYEMQTIIGDIMERIDEILYANEKTLKGKDFNLSDYTELRDKMYQKIFMGNNAESFKVLANDTFIKAWVEVIIRHYKILKPRAEGGFDYADQLAQSLNYVNASLTDADFHARRFFLVLDALREFSVQITNREAQRLGLPQIDPEPLKLPSIKKHEDLVCDNPIAAAPLIGDRSTRRPSLTIFFGDLQKSLAIIGKSKKAEVPPGPPEVKNTISPQTIFRSQPLPTGLTVETSMRGTQEM